MTLARLLVDMGETDRYGYYHATNEGGFINWYDFTCEIYRQSRHDYQGSPGHNEGIRPEQGGPPFSSRLDKSKLAAAGFTPPSRLEGRPGPYLAQVLGAYKQESNRNLQTSMETIKIPHESRFLDIYGKVLKWSALIYAEGYIMFTLLEFVMWELYLRRRFKQLGTILLLAALVYVLLRQRQDRTYIPGMLTRIRGGMTFEHKLMILFLLWFIFDTAVRTVLDQTRFFKYNDNRLFYTVLSTLLYYPFAELAGKERTKEIFEKLTHFNMFYYTLVCAWAIWKYYNLEFMRLPSGRNLENYYSYCVSFQMGGNINIMAANSAIMLGLCLYMFVTNQRRAVKIAYIPAAIVHVVAVLLTNSRGSYLTILCMTFAAAFLYAWERLADKKAILKAGAALAAAILCTGAIVLVRTPLLTVFAERGVMDPKYKVRTGDTGGEYG